MSCEGRSTIVLESMKRACVKAVTVGEFDHATIATRVIGEQFARQISEQAMQIMCTLCTNSSGLMACVKKKKPLLLEKNIRACLTFAK